MFDSDDFNELLFFPRRDASQTPAGAVDLRVPVVGADLHLRWHRAKESRATMLLFHGNGEVVADYDSAAPSFAAAGAALAVVDYRGYGRSSGTPSLRNIIEDAPLVLRDLGNQTQGPIIVMGRSLGSACACELYGSTTSRVAGFILESGFVDLQALAGRRGISLLEIDPGDREVFDPLPKLRRGHHPLLVLHGALDDLIVPAEARAAFENAGAANKKLVLVEGRGHNDIAESTQYWAAIKTFVNNLTS